MDAIINIAIMCISGYYIYKMYKEYKKYDSMDEKILFWIILIIIFVPTIIYILDRNNIFSKWNWFKNTTSNRWFNFFTTYFSALVSAIIGALVLIAVTTKQINEGRKKDLLDKRIQNAPLFKYIIQNKRIENAYPISLFNNSKEKNKHQYSIFFEIENIGLNLSRKIEIEVYVDNKNLGTYNLDDSQSILKKNEKKAFVFSFDFKINKNSIKEYKNIEYIINYMDVLKNKYRQVIQLRVLPTLIYEIEACGYHLNLESIVINDEENLEE